MIKKLKNAEYTNSNGDRIEMCPTNEMIVGKVNEIIGYLDYLEMEIKKMKESK